MAETTRCPICHAELPADAPQGLCPACLLLPFLQGDRGDLDPSGDDPAAPDSWEGRPVDEVMAAGPAGPDVDGNPGRDGTALPGPSATAEVALDLPSSERIGMAIGPYQIVRLLGAGGMGAVYEAIQEQPIRRTVALKIIRPGMDTGRVVARFEAERQALAMMDHPNIARVLDGGSTPEGQPYFVMELVRGVPITRFCETQRLGYRERLELFVPVCQAIQHAHQKGVIHRDIKPSNVLVTTYDGRAVPKVIDFGLAKAIGQPLIENADCTGIDTILGTLPYMSPEQAGAGPDVDTRTDVYALGVLLYELLTGTTPVAPKRLEGAALAEVLRVIREEEPPRPSLRLSQAKGSPDSMSSLVGDSSSRLRNALRQELDWVVMKSLEKDRSRRYQSASKLAEEIGRYLGDEPVEARPPSRAYRLKKFMRRHRAGVMMAVLSLIALTTLAVVSILFSIRLSESLRETNRRAAGFWFERGQAAFEREEVGQGLRSMVESWRSAVAARDPAWQHAARAALSAAHRQGPKVLSIFSHGGAIRHVGFSPDGRMAFTASLDRTVRLWDVATGHPVGEPLGHRLAPTVVVFTADCSRVITGDEAGIARFWDIATGKPSAPALLNIGPVRGLAIGPDGKTVLTAGGPNPLEWKRETLDAPRRAAFSPTGQDTRGEIQLWDAATGERSGLPIMMEAPVLAAAFSHDGRTIVAGCLDQTARRWDAATGNAVGPAMLHQGAVLAVAFSPDGRTILTGSEDRMARLWDAAGGTLVGEPLPHQGAVRAVAFTPDGKAFLTGSDDGMVRLWDSATRRAAGEPMNQPLLRAAALSPDGRLILAGGGDFKARLFAAGTGKPRLVISAPGRTPVLAAAFSPDGRTVLVGGGAPELRREEYWRSGYGGAVSPGTNLGPGFLWAQDADTGRSVKWRETTAEPLRAVAYRLDGRSVLAATDWDARILDAETGRPIGAPLEHRGLVRAVAFSPDGRIALTAGSYGARLLYRLGDAHQPSRSDQEIRLWDAATGASRLRMDSYSVAAVGFGRDGKECVVVGGPAQNAVRSVDLSTGKTTSPVYTSGSRAIHPSPILPGPMGSADRTVAISRDGRSALVGFGYGAFFLDLTVESPGSSSFDWRSPEFAARQHRGPVRAVALSLDAQVALTGAEDGTARLWSTRTGQPLADPLVHSLAVNDVAFSPDGRIALTGSDDGTARLWDAATGKRLGVPLVHQSPIRSVAFSPDGKHILTGCEDGQSYLWDPALEGRAGIALAPESRSRILAAACSPDGELVLTGDDKGVVRIWDARTGGPLGQPWTHPQPVHAVAFSPDGNSILVGTWMQARLYDAATTAPRGAPLIHQNGFVRAVAFSPDGKLALTGGDDSFAWLWDTTTGQAVGKPMVHQKSVSAVAYSPDGRTVAIAVDTDVQIYETPATAPPGRPLKHPGAVRSLLYSPDGKILLTRSDDGRARLWDVATGEARGHPLASSQPIRAAAFAPDGKAVITGGADGMVQVWDAAHGQALGEPLEIKGSVQAVGFSPDGKTIFIAAEDGTAWLRDSATRRPLGRPIPIGSKVASVQLSASGRTLLVLGQDGSVRCWDVAELPDDLDRVAAWIEVSTGLTVNSEGSIKTLDRDARQRRQERLRQLGGPP
jgi:WD40 repeat protein/serine/threonine protein kinase